MKNKAYVRVTHYKPPPNTTTAQLARLASVSEPAGILEGYLLADVTIRAPIRVRQRFRDGMASAEDFTTLPVTRLEDGYALTSEGIFQFVRVPGPKPAPGAAEPGVKAPIRTTVSKREYHLLREDLWSQMAALGPDVVLVAALFKLHAEQFAKVRAAMPDERTGEAFSVVDLEAEFTVFQDALSFRYSSRDQRDKREKEVWIAGHQCLNAIRYAVYLQAAFMAERGLLAIFTGCQARIQRMLHAWQHFATLLPEGATHGTD